MSWLQDRLVYIRTTASSDFVDLELSISVIKAVHTGKSDCTEIENRIYIGHRNGETDHEGTLFTLDRSQLLQGARESLRISTCYTVQRKPTPCS